MQKNTKTFLLIGGVIAAIVGLLSFPASKLLAFRNKASFNITGIKKFDIIGFRFAVPIIWGECRIKFDINIDNPIPEQYNITVPYIRAYYDQKLLGNSIPRPDVIVVKPAQRTTITDVDFRFPTTNINSVLGINLDTVKSMISQRIIKLNKNIVFVIGLTIDGFETSVEQTVTI
jgi:hypothetical protein